MRWLRGIAWTVFCLDLVILAQLGYGAITAADPLARSISRGLATLCGSGLLGLAVLLAVSSWLPSRAGLWLGLIAGALPLLWVLGAIIAGAIE